jgi:DNA-binding beta-propeller fold protein YncE
MPNSGEASGRSTLGIGPTEAAGLTLHATVAVGTGRFDHADVDVESGLAFFAHSTGDTVVCVDGPRERALAATLPAPGISGIVVDSRRGLLLAAAKRAGQLLIGATATPTHWAAAVDVGAAPNGIAVDTVRGRALAADVERHDACLVDLAGPRVLAHRPLPGRPRWTVFDEQADRYLVAIAEPAAVVAVGADFGSLSTWPVQGQGPHGLAIDTARRRVFVACDDATLLVLDAGDGLERFRWSLPGSPDVTWYDPHVDLVYVGVGDPGVVAVIRPQRGHLGNVVTEPGAKTSAVDIRRRRLYVPYGRAGRLAIYALPLTGTRLASDAHGSTTGR